MASEVRDSQTAEGSAEDAEQEAESAVTTSEAVEASEAGAVSDELVVANGTAASGGAAAPNGKTADGVSRDAGVDVADTATADAANGTAASADSAESGADGAATGDAASAATGDAAAADQVEAEAGDAAEPTRPPRKPRRLPVLIAVAALALAIDIVSKMLVVQHMENRAPIRLPGGWLYITLIRNSGAAFNIGEGQTWVFTIIAAAVVFVILRVSRNLRSLPWACALGLLLGGALGNLADRVFREPGLFRGHVVDFLQFPTFPLVHYNFPVFNLADSSIVAGGCLMVLLSFLGMQPDGTRHHQKEAGPKG